MDVTLNRPEIVAEITTLFERYEQALVEKDVAVLDATFWDSPHTIRYALAENCYGFAGDADSAALVARRHVETFRDMTLDKVIASLRDTAVVAPVQPAQAGGDEP